MKLKLVTLAVVLFSIFHSNIKLFVISQQNVQPYFTEWNGSYYLFKYKPSDVTKISWATASDDCEADNGRLPVITIAERDALLDDFFRASSKTNDDGFVWLGADCSGNTCTGAGTVLNERLWDADLTSGFIYYPTANAGNNPNRAMAWFKVRGNVQDVSVNSDDAGEFICKYDSPCASIYAFCLPGGACVSNSSVTRHQCVCLAGYEPTPTNTGCVDIDECSSDPCDVSAAVDNRRICINEVNAYRCQCINDFTGDSCETTIDDCAATDDPCNGSGECVDDVASFSCSCFPGFTGERCEFAADGAQASVGAGLDDTSIIAIVVSLTALAVLAAVIVVVVYMRRKRGKGSGGANVAVGNTEQGEKGKNGEPVPPPAGNWEWSSSSESEGGNFPVLK